MERTPPRLEGAHWETPEQQPETVKILQSTERPNITLVFGTTVPPTGVSGKLRGVAFKYSENDLRHWMILLLADRINMVEGIVSDLGRGHIPNLFAETGMKAEFRYNRPAAINKMAIVTTVMGVGLYLISRKNKKS